MVYGASQWIYTYICYTIVSQPELFVFLMEEADIEDEQGNITKELYVLQVAPLESHARYRLKTEDPAVFSDGGDDDPDSWVCPQVRPHVPIPVHRKRSAPSTSVGATNVTSEASCGSAHTQLKKDFFLQHHNLVKLMAALDVDACKEYHMHSTQAVLSHIQQGNKTCTICQHICSSTQALKVYIRGQHMDDPSLQCDQCDYTAGDKYGLDLHHHSHLSPESRYQCDQCLKSYSQNGT